MNLKNLQGAQIPAFWRDEQYSDAYNTLALPHRHFNHALTHSLKALGQLAAYSDALDHGAMEKHRDKQEVEHLHDQVAKWLADVVICTARMAQQVGVDLDAAVTERLISLGKRWSVDMPSTRPSIEELEAILREDPGVVEVLPNGEVAVRR